MRAKRILITALLTAFVALAAVGALAADAVKSTNYYNIHYDQWQGVADSLAGYLDAAFTTPRDVLGYDNGGYGKIDIYFYSDAKSATLGYTVAGSNSFYLNLTKGSSTSDSYLRSYGSVAAHETAHVLFFHKTKASLGSSEAPAYTWVTEALSYYVGDVVYPHGAKYSKGTLGALLSRYSSNGASKTSWWSSGDNYRKGTYSELDLVQLQSIGLFLAENGGWGNIQGMLNNLAQGNSVESAFQKAYGKGTGQTSTASGADVKTLYSDYLNYYLGHY